MSASPLVYQVLEDVLPEQMALKDGEPPRPPQMIMRSLKMISGFQGFRLTLVLGLIGIIASGCDDIAQPEIHLIPQGYSGEVFILHRVAAGEPMVREGWSRIYRIPPGGVLRSSTDANEGWRMSRFFYLAADGRCERITGYWAVAIADTPENRNDPKVGIHGRSAGFLLDRAHRCPVRYEKYFVGTKRQLLAMTGAGEGLIQRYFATHYACLQGTADLPKPGPGNAFGFSQ